MDSTTATDTSALAQDVADAAPAATPEMVDSILNLTQNSIYLMGASFVLGSLFTLFLLLVLDFVRRGKGEREY